MIEGLAALILLTALSLIQTTDILQHVPLTVAEVGDNLNLTCQVSSTLLLFFWYKVKSGYMIQTVIKGSELVGQFKNPRFKFIKIGDLHTLNIRNISKNDEATYFCQAGEPYMIPSFNGTILAVNDHKNLEQQVYVKQSAETESVNVGHSVTLKCSLLFISKENSVQCPGEHNVYWFKTRNRGSDHGILYTNSSRRNKQEKNSCIYSLSKTIHSSSDAGNYYCAVVTCGQILFGEGTKVETKQILFPLLIVSGTLMSCCVLVIATLYLCRKKNPVCDHCKGETSAPCHAQHVRSPEDQPHYGDGDAAELNYAGLDFISTKAKRGKNRDVSHCIYSGMREENW